jgi:hypothetical protein
MEKIKIDSPIGDLMLAYCYDTDNGGGFDIYDENGEYLSTLWGWYAPDKSDPDYSEMIQSLTKEVYRTLNLNYFK